MTALRVWLATHPKVTAFLAATGQRVVRSFAASLFAVKFVGSAVVATISWGDAVQVAGGAAVGTLLLCILGQATTGDGPAFGGTEVAKTPS